MTTQPTTNRPRRPSLGTVLLVAGVIVCLGIIGSVYESFQTRIRMGNERYAAQAQVVSRLETAYGQVRAQVLAAHLPPAGAPLTVVVGGGLTGTKEAPALITFTFKGANGKIAGKITCTDPTGEADYVCLEPAPITPPAPTSTTVAPAHK